MFKKQKWSKELKKAATELLNYITDFVVVGDEEKLAKLINMALDEGRRDVLDDPYEYDLLSKEDCRDCEPPWEDDEDCR